MEILMGELRVIGTAEVTWPEPKPKQEEEEEVAVTKQEQED